MLIIAAAKMKHQQSMNFKFRVCPRSESIFWAVWRFWFCALSIFFVFGPPQKFEFEYFNIHENCWDFLGRRKWRRREKFLL